MAAYLTRAERAALAKLPVAERRRVLSERFARECPNPERTDYPGLGLPLGVLAAPPGYDVFAARELDEIEAQVEREQRPPARVVQLISPATPLFVGISPYEQWRCGFRGSVPVVALALREDGTISALTEYDVPVGGHLAVSCRYAEVLTEASATEIARREKAQAAK